MTTDLRAALLEARELVRVERFLAVVDAEAGSSASRNFLAALAPVFHVWRRALREGDEAGALDAARLASGTLEACRRALLERDRAIPPYRVRWACDHEPVGSPGLPRLLRFYRLLHYSPPTQSKYEFVLTRVFAGPLRPRRTLVAPKQALVQRLAAMERAWGAPPVVLDDAEVQAITRDLTGFAEEAGRCVELGELVGEGLFQRTGRYKAALGEKLYEPRVSLAAVECAVAHGDAFFALLAREEGRAPDEAPAEAPGPGPEEPEVVSEEELLQGADLPADERALEQLERLERLVGTSGSVDLAAEAPPVEAATAAEERAIASAASEQPEREQPVPALPETAHARATPGAAAAGVGPAARQGATASASEEPEPQPSPRAGELGRQPENAVLIAAYLRAPRSTEVYHLNLDMFLSSTPGEAATGPNGDVERRRALELILAADDLGWEREATDGPPSEEYRARVKEAAREMTALGASLRGRRAKAPPEAARALLYLADNLLWERLRLEARSRRPARVRPKISLAQSRPGAASVREPRIPRRWALLAGAAAAVVVVILVLMRSLAAPMAVGADVQVLDTKTLPGAEHLHDARVRRSMLFVTVRLSWTQQGENARRANVTALGRFGADRGITAVTLADRTGQPLASFADGLAMLAGDPPREVASQP